MKLDMPLTKEITLNQTVSQANITKCAILLKR